MTSLDIKIYNENFASIKDLSKDLNIGDAQWNSLFELLNRVFESTYFQGSRKWSKNEDFDQTLDFISEQILVDQGKEHSEILLRLKSSFVMYNRRLVSQMWDYYEYPCFIFLGDKNNEQALIQKNGSNLFYDSAIENIEDVVIMYRSFEQNVLWIKGNITIKEILQSVE